MLETHGFGASLKYDNGRKYWFRLRAADFEGRPLPDEFINVVRKKDKIECQTLALIKLNVRLADAAHEVVLRSDNIIQTLITDLRQEVPHLFRLCESIALVDMVSSFGQLATTRDYVRPELDTAMALKGARHPVLDKVISLGVEQEESNEADHGRWLRAQRLLCVRIICLPYRHRM